jgi:RNA polymerase sigma factor (TIGR02999 family)
VESEDITRLLAEAGGGDEAAMNEVIKTVYPRLRQIAEARRRAWRGDETLSTTAIVHEAYLKVASSPNARFESRGHFFAVVAKAMRQVLLNYAEMKSAAKRGGGDRAVTLQDGDLVTGGSADEILALGAALEKLEAVNPRQARVVECLFFAGLEIAETAEALDISPATVKRDWSAARAWLYREMERGNGASG